MRKILMRAILDPAFESSELGLMNAPRCWSARNAICATPELSLRSSQSAPDVKKGSGGGRVTQSIVLTCEFHAWIFGFAIWLEFHCHRCSVLGNPNLCCCQHPSRAVCRTMA
jgi:hypothetical protein